MKTKQELLRQIEEWQAKGKELQQAIQELPEPVGRWKPKFDEKYWFTTEATGSGVNSNRWLSSSIDQIRYNRANVYRTKEEAQAALDRQLATVRVLDRIAELNAEQGWVCDWNKSSRPKFLFTLTPIEQDELDLSWSNNAQCLPTSYYGSRQTIETVTKEMPEDCKLMLGVSEK